MKYNVRIQNNKPTIFSLARSAVFLQYFTKFPTQFSQFRKTKFSFSAKNCLFNSTKFSFILFVLTVHHLYNNSADVP